MLSVYVAAVLAGKQKANGTLSRFSARTDIKNVKTRFAIISDGRVYSQRHILTTRWGRFHKQTEALPPFPLPSICPPAGNCLLSCRYCQVSSSIVSIGKKGLMATLRELLTMSRSALSTPPQSPDTQV